MVAQVMALELNRGMRRYFSEGSPVLVSEANQDKHCFYVEGGLMWSQNSSEVWG